MFLAGPALGGGTPSPLGACWSSLWASGARAGPKSKTRRLPRGKLAETPIDLSYRAHSNKVLGSFDIKTTYFSVACPIRTNRAVPDLKRSLRIAPLRLAEGPKFLQVMAHSPAVLRAYILADAALVRGQLTRRQRKQVA